MGSLTDAAVSVSCLQMPGDPPTGQAEMCPVAQEPGKRGIEGHRVCHQWEFSEQVG